MKYFTANLFLFILIISFSDLYSQDIVEINNQFYTAYFSKSKHIPVIVTYSLNKSMVQCKNHFSRKDKFIPDPQLIDYTNLKSDYYKSGFSRGHNMSAANNTCDSIGMVECFYFSNMTPQPQCFNNGNWKKLEEIERDLAVANKNIITTIGSIGVQTKIGKDSVVVPQYMWKVIYVPKAKLYSCYYFPDSGCVNKKDLKFYEVSLDKIDSVSCIEFHEGHFSFCNKVANTRQKIDSISISSIPQIVSDNTIPPSVPLKEDKNVKLIFMETHEMHLLVTLLIAAILGATGQGIRIIFNLRRTHEDAVLKGQKFATEINYKDLVFTLLAGFCIGAMAGIATVVVSPNFDFDTRSELLGFVAAGYSGTDALEALIGTNFKFWNFKKKIDEKPPIESPKS